jgi:tetratricopeptide (TPR) repeat protein
MLGKKEEAASLARGIISENEEFLGAYDFLGGVLTETGKKDEALQVLQTAREKSPGTLSRVRTIGSLAVDAGQHDVAEQVLREALKQHKYSAVREAQDYATLSRSLSAQGKPDEALAVLKEAAFKDATSNMLLAASESVAYSVAGDKEKAEEALNKVLEASHGNLPPNIAAVVADACFALGKEEKAMELLKQVVQNNPDDAKLHARAHAVLSAAGKGTEEATAIIEASMREIIQINNEGVRKAEAGQFNEAVPLLCNAADRLPNNLQMVGNAALVLALDMARNGYNPLKMKECVRYRQMVADKSQDYPKIAQVDAVLKQVKKD